MKLKKLLADLPITLHKGNKELQITGLCNHSKRVAPGNLFIARKGTVHDGSHYIQEAIKSGAAAILTDMPDPFIKEVAQLIHPDPAAMEGQLAAHFYNHPSRELLLIGVTGTNGKTTTATLIHDLYTRLGIPCGLIGTVEYILGSHHFPAERTTPDALTNHKLLREMVSQGCRAAVMEVSSHGLVQNRLSGLEFDAALFTNLSQDHLDYHRTMEEYADAKKRLFTLLPSDKLAIANADSTWTSHMLSECSAHVHTFGFTEEADLRATNIHLSAQGSTFDLTFRDQTLPFEIPLIGRYNILNTLAALSLFLHHPLEVLQTLAKTLPSIPGRLERHGQAFIDYAHTPDALEKALTALREVTSGRLIAVFGCGGDRDQEKRSQMGRVAERFADYTLITSDNPRREDPETICHAIAAGFTTENYMIEPDRRRAIEKALESAQKDDLILIAGKGHEKTQVFSHTTIPFDDTKVVSDALLQI